MIKLTIILIISTGFFTQNVKKILRGPPTG